MFRAAEALKATLDRLCTAHWGVPYVFSRRKAPSA